MKCSDRFSDNVMARLRNDITEAMGNEVLWVGELETDGQVSHITSAARGNARSVPALFPFMEKGDVVIHNHPSGVLQPSEADLGVASRLGNDGIGFFIIDNDCENLYVVAETVKNKGKVTIDAGKVSHILGPRGAVSRAIESYEPRESQQNMSMKVAGAFNEDKIAVCEAGTGVGKSFAYLIPAFMWAAGNDERIVVATRTINLQQQLFDKDIPLVKSFMKTEVKSCLIKGRRNYLCMHRLREYRSESTSLFEEEDQQLSDIEQWAVKSKEGSITEIPFKVKPELWSMISSESDSCLGLRCSQREGCFIIKARKRAAASQILVVNHHLLFADIAVRNEGLGYDASAVLPPFQRIIFDEAHNIESSATSFFSKQLSRFSMTRLLSRLFRRRGTRRAGVVFMLCTRYSFYDDLAAFQTHVENSREALRVFESISLGMLAVENSFHLEKSIPKSQLTELLTAAGNLQNHIIDMCDICGDIIKKVKDKDAEDKQAYELKLVLRKLESAASFLQKFREYDEHLDKVIYFERSRGRGGAFYVRFYITPIDIAAVMAESLYSKFASIIMTSATLTVQNSFAAWFRRVGIDLLKEDRVSKDVFPSPFPYETNVLFAIPADGLEPSSPGYVPYLNEKVAKLLSITNGRGLVLFTSYSMLLENHNAVKPVLRELGISVYKQGDEERGRLFESFKTDVSSVLFATESFWEGIDAPGEALTAVIICRLPFGVPTDPVTKARMEKLKRSGGNPFMDYSLPEAVFKLKQGFGRLMRRNSDRGIVCVLDKRIISKRYGKVFFESLPQADTRITEFETILDNIESFLY